MDVREAVMKARAAAYQLLLQWRAELDEEAAESIVDLSKVPYPDDNENNDDNDDNDTTTT